LEEIVKFNEGKVPSSLLQTLFKIINDGEEMQQLYFSRITSICDATIIGTSVFRLPEVVVHCQPQHKP